MKMSQFAKFANDATAQMLGVTGLQLENLQSMFSYPDAINVLNPVTVSGNVIYIEDGAPLNAKHAIINIVPSQSGNGDPSPDNVRPLSGWTRATILRSGKNLLPMTVEGIKSAQTTGGTWEGNVYTVTGVKHTILTDSENNVVGIRVDGTPAGSRTLFKLCDYKSEIDTILSGCPSGGSVDSYEIQFNTNRRDFGNGVSIAGNNITGNVYIIIRPGYTASNLIFIPMIRSAYSENSIFEPYHSELYSIVFPAEVGIVYGGTLNITKGVLNACPYYASYNGETLVGPWISSMDVYAPGETPTTGAQVVDLGGAPTTYQLTPTNILLLNGVNTIYANCGSMELEYYRREGGGNPYV